MPPPDQFTTNATSLLALIAIYGTTSTPATAPILALPVPLRCHKCGTLLIVTHVNNLVCPWEDDGIGTLTDAVLAEVEESAEY